jgi:hypothetical protein
MTAASTVRGTPHARRSPRLLPTNAELASFRQEVKQGWGGLAVLHGPSGLSWVELHGPKGVGQPDGYLQAQVPTLRLCVPDVGNEPVATAAANRDFPAELAALEATARPHVFDDEHAWLRVLLRTVKEAVPKRRPRIPKVGSQVQTLGQPSIFAWSSALSLADLEASLRRAVP